MALGHEGERAKRDPDRASGPPASRELEFLLGQRPASSTRPRLQVKVRASRATRSTCPRGRPRPFHVARFQEIAHPASSSERASRSTPRA